WRSACWPSPTATGPRRSTPPSSPSAPCSPDQMGTVPIWPRGRLGKPPLPIVRAAADHGRMTNTITFPSGARHEIPRDDAEALIVDVFKEPTGEPNVLHVHARSDERFDIVAGRMLFTVGGPAREVGPGDFVWIPRGTVHQWRVIGDEPLH